MADSHGDGVPRLIVRVGDGTPLELRLGETTTIGRDSDCDVCLSDPRISRLHCEISCTGQGYIVTDLGSQNGTFLNGERVMKCVLRSGDILKVGSTEIVFDALAPALPVGAFAGKRAPVREASGFWGFRCRTFYIVLSLIFLLPLSVLLVTYGEGANDQLGSIALDVVNWVSETYVGLTKSVPPPHSSRPEVVEEKSPRKEVPWKNEKSEVAEREPVREVEKREDSYLELSRRAVEDLRQRVMDALAAKDLELAEGYIASFKKSDFSYHHLDTIRDLEDKISAVKREMAKAERERLALIEKRWKDVEAKVQQFVAAEQYDEAKESLKELLDDPDLMSRAQTLSQSISGKKDSFIRKTLPARRSSFEELVALLHPFLQKREYDRAVEQLKRLGTDARFKEHTPMLLQEQKHLDAVSFLYKKIIDAIRSIPENTGIEVRLKSGKSWKGKYEGIKGGDILWMGSVKDGDIFLPTTGAPLLDIKISSLLLLSGIKDVSPLTISDLHLYESDYSAACESIVDMVAVDFSSVNDFFIRFDLFQKALMESDLNNAIGRAETLISQGKIDKAEEILTKVERKYSFPTVAEIPIFDVQSPPEWLGNIPIKNPILEAVHSKLEQTRDKRMFSNISYKQLRVLKEKGRADEKVRLLKSLKVVGDKEVLPFIISALDDDSVKVRFEAVQALSVLGTEKNTWDLAKMCDDPVREVALSAIAGVKKIGANPEIIREKYKNSNDSREKRIAVKSAGFLQEEKLLTILKDGLGNTDWQVRKESAISLAKLKLKSSGDALVVAIKKESFDSVEAAIAYALGAIKYENGVSALGDLLVRKPNHPFKNEIVKAIGEIGGNSAAKILKKYLKDLNPWVRYCAVEALSKSDTKIKEEDVKNLLVDDRWLNRAGAVSAMIAGGDDGSLSTLVKILGDDHPAVRATAHHGLLSWGNSKVITAILKEIDSLGGEGAMLARDVLKTLTGQDFATTTEWRNWWSVNKATFRMPVLQDRFKVNNSQKGVK